METQIETIYGTLNLIVTDAKHIFLYTPNAEVLTINGVAIRGLAHMYLWNDKQWHIGNEHNSNGRPNTAWEARMSGLHFDKAGVDYSKNTLSGSQEKKLTEMLVLVTLYWTEKHKVELQKAEIRSLKTRLENKIAETIELKSKLLTAYDEVDAIEKERDGKLEQLRRELNDPTLTVD